MIKKISVTTVIEQVIQHMSVLNLGNYLKKQGKRIVLHDNDDIQDIAQAVQDLNTKTNSMKLNSSTFQLKDSLCIEGNPKICPKPCPSVPFCLKLDKIEETDLEDSFVETETESFQNENTFSCSEQEQTQLGELFSSPEVESDNLSESDIRPFDILYGKMDEDNFHQKMEGNDLTYYPLFSDKEFLNKDWHNYTCIESCAAIEDVRHGCKSLRTDIQSIREIDDSGCMLKNITGSSILKSTDHTSQVKPGKLSVRFILNDREPCSYNPSSVFQRTSDLEQSEVVSEDESEIGIVSESEDDWYSCESSEEENECFYDAVSLVNSHDASLISLPHQVTETPCETNLHGLVLGCRQPSKSDQASDLEEKACLHVAIQVPELNETYLCEGKQKTKNDVSQLRILSSMMEKETDVDNTSSGEQADICHMLPTVL